MSTKRNNNQLKSWIGAACLLALTGCDTGGDCLPKTEDDLSHISNNCYNISIADSEITSLENMEFTDPISPVSPDGDHSRILTVADNDLLTTIGQLPHSIYNRIIVDNPELKSLDMGDVFGTVEIERNASLKEVRYSITQQNIEDEPGILPKYNHFYISGNSDISTIEIACSLNSCVLDSFEASRFLDISEGIDVLTNATVPGTIAPDLSDLQIQLDDNISVKRLDLWSIQHLTTLQAFYGIHVTDSVWLRSLPELNEGEVEAFHQHLISNGFTGEFNVCDIAGYPDCCGFDDYPDSDCTQ